MKPTSTFFKTTIIIFSILLTTLMFAQQSDSIYFYNYGQKDWYHIQKDVYAFRATNGLPYTANYDQNVVEKVIHRANSPRKINEMHFKQGVSETQKNIERNKVRTHPIYECEFPVLTKEPNKDKSFNEWKPTNDIVMVAFKDPVIPTAAIQQFKVKNNLILERQPDIKLPKTHSWTYAFRVPVTKCGSENAVDIAKKIWESSDSAILKFIIPDMLLVRSEVFSKLPFDANFPPNSSSADCYIHNDYSKFQWWVGNGGNITYKNQGGNLSTNDADADICECWAAGYKGYGIKTAVIDFHGFEFDHEDMNGQFLNGWNTTTSAIGTPLVTTVKNDTNYHGMAVSGIIAAIGDNDEGILGVAYHSKVIPILISGFNDEITLGLQKAVELGADIINMSFATSGGMPESVTNEIKNAYETGRPNQWNPEIKYGCVLVAGAGNDGFPGPRYPAAYPEVIGVGGSNPNDFRSISTDGWGWASGGSNYGPHYDVVAPSSFLRSLRWMGSGTGGGLNTNYDIDLPGTSFGTPIVSGVAAMLLEKNPQLFASEVKTALRNGAEKVNPSTYDYNYDSADPGRSLEMQFGRVNCMNSLNSIPVGINELTKISSINITAYYNGQNELIISYDLKQKTNKAVIIIYDILGKEILQKELPVNQNQTSVPLNKFPQGIYLLNIQSEDGIKLAAQKFVKY